MEEKKSKKVRADILFILILNITKKFLSLFFL